MAWPQVYKLQAHDLQRQRIQRPRPTILLIHDAFLTPVHFSNLYRALTAAGERVVVPQLPSSSYTVSASALEADIRTLIDQGKAEIDTGRDIVVVAHGYGAISALIAAERLNRYSLDRPRAGHISKVVLIAGVVLRSGQSWMDAVQPPWISISNGSVRVDDAEDVFFQDCPRRMRTQAAASTSAHGEYSLRTPVDAPGRVDVPITYLTCYLNNAIAPALQEGFVRELQAGNRRVSVVGRRTGHCPFLVAADDVASLILETMS